MMTGCGTGGATGAAGGPARHIPVLLSEVLTALGVSEGGRFIDATFGAGGYTRAILDAGDTRVLAVDRDPEAIKSGARLIKGFSDRLVLAEGRFGELEAIAGGHGFVPADGIVFDIGVSSMQLDDAARGFSFMRDGPLDMRMSQSGETAAEIVNSRDAGELGRIFKLYGEERRARAVAKAIVSRRADTPITRTAELAELVARVVKPARGDDKHPATRVFQALRIAVNRELDELVDGLAAAERLLRDGGRLAVVTFHSLEDRIVKRFLRERAGQAARASRHLPPGAGEDRPPSFQIVNPRPLSPGNDEIVANPRARSARLRIAERTAAQTHPLDPNRLGLPGPPGAARDRTR